MSVCWADYFVWEQQLPIFQIMRKQLDILVPGHNTTEVEEVFPSPPPQNPDLNPDYEKTVWISNAGGTNSECSVPCYTRAFPLSYSHSDISKALHFKNLNTTDWIYNSQDGFYYYRYVLQKGEKQNLFSQDFTLILLK